MEVHHHPYCRKENFKEYFMEFLMIFLAAFSSCTTNNSLNNCVMFHGGETHTGVYEQAGNKNFGAIKWKFKTNGKIFSSPAIVKGIAYAGSEDSNLYAVNI